MIPLTLIEPGEEALVHRLSGSSECREQLTALGFQPGATVSIVSIQGENAIVSVREARVAISMEILQNVLIEEINRHI